LISSPLFSSAFSSSMQSIRRIRTRTHVRAELLFLVLTPFFVVAQHPMAHTNLSDSDTALCVCGSCCWEVEHWWTQERERKAALMDLSIGFSPFSMGIWWIIRTHGQLWLFYMNGWFHEGFFSSFFGFCCFLFVFFFASSHNAI
jgi:apolipoprotein N-acyltransferase